MLPPPGCNLPLVYPVWLPALSASSDSTFPAAPPGRQLPSYWGSDTSHHPSAGMPSSSSLGSDPLQQALCHLEPGEDSLEMAFLFRYSINAPNWASPLCGLTLNLLEFWHSTPTLFCIHAMLPCWGSDTCHPSVNHLHPAWVLGHCHPPGHTHLGCLLAPSHQTEFFREGREGPWNTF